MNQPSNDATKRDLDLARAIRRNLIAVAKSVTPQQTETIPAGFNNNILWNLGHCLATQQILCYRLSGLAMALPEELVNMLRKGTSPKDWTTSPDFDSIEAQLLPLIDATEADLEAGKFEDFSPYQTSFGVKLETIGDAIRFNNVHESLHLGYMMALKRLVAG
jgi:hypothetical protein